MNPPSPLSSPAFRMSRMIDNLKTMLRGRQLDLRRLTVGVLAVVSLVLWGGLAIAPESWVISDLFGGLFGDQAGGRFAAGMLGRLGLMMSALWLAWPSLRRPASWLPPGAIMLVVGAIAIVAVRPRLVALIIPAVGGLVTLGWLVKLFRR